MKYHSADYIFPVSGPPIKGGIVAVDDDGRIAAIGPPSSIAHQPSSLPDRQAGLISHSGIIVPGFVNAHCHLELSHLKGQLKEGAGLTRFIEEIIPKRGTFTEQQILKAIADGDEEMRRNGIVAVGDISNMPDTFAQKKKSLIRYHTFIEVFDLDAARAAECFRQAEGLRLALGALPASISPHAPYSVSEKLMGLIDALGQDVISIHNQETPPENEMFVSGTGPMADLMRKFGVDVPSKTTGKGSLEYALCHLPHTKKVLLVHNTYTTTEDVRLFTDHRLPNTDYRYFCLCPNANLYIENRLPDVPMLAASGVPLCIGTDSYASNWSLSVLDEMKTLAKNFPKIPFEALLTWATKNGAEALGFSGELGTIEPGKRPGLNLITGMGEGMRLIDGAAVITLQ